MVRKKRRRRAYATDLTDVQWALIAPLIPEAEPGGRPRSDTTLSVECSYERLLATDLNRIVAVNPFEDTVIDHLNIGVYDADRSRAFYETALAPLGLKLLHSIPPEQAEDGGEQQKTRGTMHGFGRQYKPLFWIVGNAKVGEGTRFAFIAQTREQVDAFYHAALAAGRTDNGPPGLRRYHENYYGAFVHDPDGINIEAVYNAEPST